MEDPLGAWCSLIGKKPPDLSLGADDSARPQSQWVVISPPREILTSRYMIL
jgi:hypothetical protein